MNRRIGAVVFGLLTFLCIADIAAGYLDFGQIPNLGTTRQIDRSREVYLTVTPEGGAVGLRAGDVHDLRLVGPAERNTIGTAGGTVAFPVERRGTIIRLTATYVRRPPGILDLLDVIMRVLLGAAGIFLIARGTKTDSLYAGIFVASLSVYEGFAVHPWGSPWVAVAIDLCERLILVWGTFGARAAFAYALLPSNVPRALRSTLAAAGAAAFLAFYAVSVTREVGLFTGGNALPQSAYWWTQMIAMYSALIIFAFAALYTKGRTSGAIRWMFGAMLISAIGPTINWISLLAGSPLPAQASLNVTYIVLAIVLPYAVLARGLVAVDFVFSRAVVYTIVLSVIVGVFIVAEKLIETAALGRVQSYVFELLVPLVLGFSIKWIEAATERIVQRVLYRDKMRASQEMASLVEDFPHARDVGTLAVRVASEVHRHMHAPFVAIYREGSATYSPIAQAGHGDALPVDADDPVFLRLRSKHAAVHTADFATALPHRGVVFPLVVFGTVTGALYAQHRESGEQFDPDEIETLTRLAHELAIALLWVETLA